MKKRDDRIRKICRDIKKIKIQGATNIAKAAITAYLLKPDAENKRILLNLRPTEPTLTNALHLLNKLPNEKVLAHFDEAQKKINEGVYKILKGKRKIYTHCHSTNVVKALIYSKRKGRKFEVYNTETRPLFQGRLTSKELSKAGIKVAEYVDAAIHEAIKKVDLVLLGADAILDSGAINKIGSGAIAEIAYIHKKPLYIVADSWKFSPKHLPLEERDFHEVWKRVPKHIKVRNPAFEKIEKKYIQGIISELGILKYPVFLKKVRIRI
jgi:ribose 1,5-bisphosphate isomerase